MKTGLFSSQGKFRNGSGVNLPEVLVTLLIPASAGDLIYEKDGVQNTHFIPGYSFAYILEESGVIGDSVRAYSIERKLKTELLLHFDGDLVDSANDYSVFAKDDFYEFVDGRFGKGISRKNDNTNDSVLTTIEDFIDLSIIPEFTVEWWEKRISNKEYGHFVINWGNKYYDGTSFGLTGKDNYYVHIYEEVGHSRSLLKLGGITVDKWTHFAVTKLNNSYSSYKDGILQDTMRLGKLVGGREISMMLDFQPGLVVDEIRISTSARYTANFTPPTEPFTI